MQITSPSLLIDDGVQDDGGLAGLAVADDQFALAAADGNHRVDGLDAGLQRLAHRLAIHDARGAMRSIGMRLSVAMGPLPSSGTPRGLTTRPIMASPTGADIIERVRLTVSPSCIACIRRAAPRRPGLLPG